MGAEVRVEVRGLELEERSCYKIREEKGSGYDGN